MSRAKQISKQLHEIEVGEASGKESSTFHNQIFGIPRPGSRLFGAATRTQRLTKRLRFDPILDVDATKSHRANERDIPSLERMMALYRCYFFDGQSHVAAVEVVDRDDDEAALRAARILNESRKYSHTEVWDKGRLVARTERVLSTSI